MAKKHSVLFVCNTCDFEEFIPKDVLEFFDVLDPDIQGAPPTFRCQQCIGILFPVDFRTI